jgi:hypothetical protein
LSRKESNIERRKVNSDKIRSVGYQPAEQVLEIEFTDGKVVQYYRVPSETHRRLLAAPSIVSYFRDHIEEEYTARRLR